MIKKTSDLDEFFVAKLLGDLFDPSVFDDIDFVANTIVNGLKNIELLTSMMLRMKRLRMRYS